MTVFWQADRRWRGETVGHGPGRFGAVGCVWFTAVHLARALTAAKDLDPVQAMDRVRADVPGAFVDKDGKPGDMMVWPIVAPQIGLVVGNAVNGPPGSPMLAAALAEALREGGAAIRIPTGNGRHHTIAAMGRREGEIVCVCSALAREVVLSWPALENLDEHWGAKSMPYRVVTVRPVRAAP